MSPKSVRESAKLFGSRAFGETREEALRAAEALVLRTLADEVEHHELKPEGLDIHFVAA